MIFKDPSEYQPVANQIFLKLKRQILKYLPYAEVEHIGSSSIQGAMSKGDLDIYVAVSKENINSSISIFEGMGFRIKQDTLRTESLCMLESSSYDIDVAIQVVRSGSEFENFLWFRDELKSNPSLVAEYNKLKIECEGFSPNKYRAKKSEFIDKVLRKKPD